MGAARRSTGSIVKRCQWWGSSQYRRKSHRTDPIDVGDVEDMIHTITNNIITKEQRTK